MATLHVDNISINVCDLSDRYHKCKQKVHLSSYVLPFGVTVTLGVR